MTWEELKEEAKKMGMEVHRFWIIDKKEWMTYYKDGTVDLDFEWNEQTRTLPFAKNRKPDQMLAIMKALQ